MLTVYQKLVLKMLVSILKTSYAGSTSKDVRLVHEVESFVLNADIREFLYQEKKDM